MASQEAFNEFRERFNRPNSKVITQQGEQILKATKEGDEDRHFRHFVKSKVLQRTWTGECPVHPHVGEGMMAIFHLLFVF